MSHDISFHYIFIFIFIMSAGPARHAQTDARMPARRARPPVFPRLFSRAPRAVRVPHVTVARLDVRTPSPACLVHTICPLVRACPRLPARAAQHERQAMVREKEDQGEG